MRYYEIINAARTLAEAIDPVPGETLTLYHGGDDPISRFDMAHASEGALFFSPSPRIARAYGPAVTKVHIRPQRTAYTTAANWLTDDSDPATDPDKLRAEGFDLLVIKGDKTIRGMHVDTYAVLNPDIIQVEAGQV